MFMRDEGTPAYLSLHGFLLLATGVGGRECFPKLVSFLLSTWSGEVCMGGGSASCGSASRGVCLVGVFPEGGGSAYRPHAGDLPGGLHPGESAWGVCIHGGWADPPNWILQDTVNEQEVHILPECILVF